MQAINPAFLSLLFDTEDFANNPRATVKEVYAVVIEDLDYAINNLAGYARKTKMYVNKDVAHGLRARAYLYMGEWQKAYDDAVAAAANYTPATREEVSKPYFMDINEHNWIWGYDMTTDMAMRYRYATTSSWLRSFSAWGYAPLVSATPVSTLSFMIRFLIPTSANSGGLTRISSQHF